MNKQFVIQPYNKILFNDKINKLSIYEKTGKTLNA